MGSLLLLGAGGKGVASAAPSTPATILTGLIGWWSMDAPANYTVTSTKVVSMLDLSGSGNTLGDGSTTQKPTYSATGLNSLPTMVCDGSTTHIDIAVFPMGTGNTLTVFGVAILTSGAWNSARLIGYSPVGFTDTGNVSSWLLARNGATAQVYLGRQLTPSGFMTASYTVPHRFIGTINSSGVITLYIDGVASTTATSAGNWTTGGKLKVGQDSGSLAEWASAISEVGVATGYSDATTVAALDLYLQTKWGL